MTEHVCVVQYDNRKRESLGNMKGLIDRNEAICKANPHCSYFFNNTEGNYPPYWEKINTVKNVLETNPECTKVLWLDTDATLHQDVLDVANVNTKALTISRDLPEYGHGPFNAGVFIVQNNSKGKEIMSEWMNLYPQTNWSKNKDGKWACTLKHNKPCVWSRNQYEQGAFNTNILNRYKTDIDHYDWKMINHRCQNDDDDNDPDAYVCHFSLNYKSSIPKYINRNNTNTLQNPKSGDM